MNEIKRIALYSYICECYDTPLRWVCQKFSPNSTPPEFTDQELLSVYLFSVMEERKYLVKYIHDYARKYLKSWFPKLPSYQAYNRRLNQMTEVFPLLRQLLLEQVKDERMEGNISLFDSLPIMTCSGKRAGKVAPALTAKGYCSTKGMYYFGVKLHAISFARFTTLPVPQYLGTTPANEPDLNAIRPILEHLHQRKLVGDKAYWDESLHQDLFENQACSLLTPVKLVKGQPNTNIKSKRRICLHLNSCLSND